MSNEIEMKRLADVEAVETVSDEASVLIVQDGEVKQTAKSNVGGAGKPVVFKVSEYIFKPTDTDWTQYATAEEFVDAYFTGTAYIDQDGYPQKIVGFYISTSSSTPYVAYPRYSSGNYITLYYAAVKCTKEDMEAAMATCLS